MDDHTLLQFYKQHLTDDLLPFWDKAMDRQFGGVYTCFNNHGTRLISTDKYIWSQGRILWIWSKLSSMIKQNLVKGHLDIYLNQLEKTAQFLDEHAFLDNGHCAFLLSESGQKKEYIDGKGYDTNFYSDCFVALGMAKYAVLINDNKRLEKAVKIYDGIMSRFKKEILRNEPYPDPAGFKSLTFPMTMLNVSQELAQAAKAMKSDRCNDLLHDSVNFMTDVMEHFKLEDDRMIEMLVEKEANKKTLLYRHRNPGHAMECMWFVMVTAERTNHQKYIGGAIDVMNKALEGGWDDKHGGLLRFVDCAGGEPKGKKLGEALEKSILDSWDMKLWWPHSESLYATLLAFHLTKTAFMLEWYNKFESYTFRTFPNRNRKAGEWIQIRNRRGEPIDKVVALPVKDPFHILRNMLLIVELLECHTMNEV